MPPTKALDQYSTNPSTLKARRRKMKLDGADKVEDAAKTADYKAMVYARKVVQNKPEYKNATATERSAMLERAMHETMEKRRSRGQDTLSKMAAFRAGEYQLRAGTRGPSTNVPISRFLVNNGYIPESASRSAIQDDEDSKSDDVTSSTPDFIGVSSGFSFNSAPTALMTNMDEPGSYSSHLVSPDIVNRGMSAPAQSSSGNSDISSAIISGSQQRSKSVLNCQSSALGVVFDTQQPIGPETSKKISSGQNMLASVEEDDHSSEVVALRFEVAQLHNMFQDVIRPHGFRNDDVDAQPQHVPLDMVDSRIKVASLEKRLAQVEGIMHAMHYASFPDISGRLDKLEEALEDLKCKAGDNCVAEVGMMKEVFRGLKESLVRVDHF